MGYFYRILRESFFFLLHKKSRRVLTFQILFTGVEALPVIAVISIGLGAIIIIQGVALLPQFGQGELVYPILITVITRELGPILTAFIIAARSGTAISTEIGNMVVSHEIEAYVSNGIDPISYLAVPRFLGVVFSMMLLNLYFNIFGLLGSFVVTTLITTIDFRYYVFNLMNALTAADILVSLAKSAVAGAIISVVATYYGFQVKVASTEVPVMAIKSVGRGFILIILSNAFLTVMYYLWT
ncbi:MAG: ABC transporter permease [Spirochaetaceae bacterium]|nr:MAG: ABC transporter permease [Spirochaetaceae bacterium]